MSATAYRPEIRLVWIFSHPMYSVTALSAACSKRLYPALLALVLACPVPSASSRDFRIEEVRLPERATFGGHELVLNGAGLRTLLGFRVYVAALYLPEPQHEAAQVLDGDVPKRLQVTLLRNITTEKNLDALKDGLIANNSPVEMGGIKTEVGHFLALLQQVHEIQAGTVIVLDYLPGVGTQVEIGNKDLGTIQGERFNRAVLKIWLGSNPIQRSLKKALLGLENS